MDDRATYERKVAGFKAYSEWLKQRPALGEGDYGAWLRACPGQPEPFDPPDEHADCIFWDERFDGREDFSGGILGGPVTHVVMTPLPPSPEDRWSGADRPTYFVPEKRRPRARRWRIYCRMDGLIHRLEGHAYTSRPSALRAARRMNAREAEAARACAAAMEAYEPPPG